MTWGKLAGLFSLKAILLACVLTPVTVATTGITAAHAQFSIPGFNIYIGPGFGRRHYYRTRVRHAKARKGRPQQEQEDTSSSTASSGSSSSSSASASNSSSLAGSTPSELLRGNKGSYRGSTD